MQDRKLEQALEIYFQGEPDERTEEFREIQKYLRLRIRPAMEFLKYGYQKKDFSL